MFKRAWFIARKDLRYTLRERETMLWLFVMPIVFFYFIGTITSGFGRSSAGQDRIALRGDEAGGFLAAAVAARLEQRGFALTRPQTDEEFNASARRLEIPAGFTSNVLAGKPQVVLLTRKEAGIGQQHDTLRVGRAVYTVLADLAATAAAGQQPTAEALAQIAAMPRAIATRQESAGRRQAIPTGFSQAIPGIMVMFTLLAMLTSGTVTLVVERKNGLLKRLSSAPLNRSEIVLGKWMGRLFLGMVQIAFALVVGKLLFRMNWGPDAPMLVIVLGAWAALCASLGLLLGSLARTEGQAIGIGVMASNALAALGGCWWPIEITPVWMQRFAKCLPTGWAMNAMHNLVNFQHGPASAVPHAAAMALAALVTGGLAARWFRYQ
jgi:ABC-type multidrug transport system permease subunit